MNRKVYVACNLIYCINIEGFLKVTGSGNILEENIAR